MSETRGAADPIPETIGRYKIEETLGFGAMGVVYKAFDPRIKRTIAIKTIRVDIPRQSPAHRTFLDRFQQEAQASGTLSHPNIVTLYDAGEDQGVPYLAMEYVEGPTVGQLLQKGERFRPERVIAIISQVAAALDYAHSHSIIHRDIKPSNLIVAAGDRVKVTDFGIAKLAEADLTAAGNLVGTPSYMSPEQALGEKVDARSDIFSLGVCAFEMLSGEQPFPGSNVTSILYRLVHADPVEPASLVSSGLVAERWHEVFSKVLAKKPENRHQTAGAFVQDLELVQGSWFAGLGDETLTVASPMATTAAEGIPTETVTISQTEAPSEPPARPDVAARRRPPAPWLVGGALVGLAAVLAVVALVRRERPATDPGAVAPTPPPEATTLPAAPVSGTLSITSEPPGASVSVDGVERGTTPLELADLAFGGHDVRLEHSVFAPQVHRLTLSAEAPRGELRAVLARPIPVTGTADFSSEPLGAAVSVDGQRLGTTPMIGVRLRPGSHQVEMTLAEHETWSGVVHVVAGRAARVEAPLRAVERTAPTPPPVDTTRVYENTPADVDTLARKLSGSSPSYPSDRAPRLRSGERVSVTVSFVVTEAGAVEDVAVVQPAGSAVDEVVTSAVRGWKYRPATKRGTPVKVRLTFKQTFLGG
jgi:serine/threonine-protein kinase